MEHLTTLDASFLQAEDSDPHVSLAVGGVSIIEGPPPDYGDLVSAFAGRAQDIPRFARDKVIASMQPYHAIDDGRWAEKRIGKDRAKTTYAFRSLLDSGATLAFGTDWTVAPLNPMLTIYAAVTRRTLDGKNSKGWVPEQKISVEETVRAYTYGSAYAEFQENVKGTITPGKLADLVILSRDIFKIDPKEIENVKVVFTMVDGRVVYEGPE